MPELDLDRYWDDRGMVCPHVSHVKDYGLHYNYMQTWLLDRIAKHTTKTLLDFGCGAGDMFECWRSAGEVFAYDRSRSMLHWARILSRQKELGYKFLGPDSANRGLVPYEDKMFDCVAMVNVLPNLTAEQFSVFAKELRRISLPGAHWLIVTSDVFDDTALDYMWNHNYDEFLGKDTKILDDHVFKPYRYIEVVYV